jgi:diguanylate cyclase (GGDEF)-like protein
MRFSGSLPRLRVFVVCVAFLSGMAAMCPAQRYTFRRYGTAQGLNNLNVVTMLEDHEGYLWLGTDNGLFRYDGARFLEFSVAAGLKDPYVVALAEDATGRLWAGTTGGLFYRDGRQFKEASAADGSLSMGQDGSLTALKDGRLLAVSRSRLFEIAAGGDDRWTARAVAGTGAFQKVQPNEAISSVFADREGRIWFGCGKGLCEVRGNDVTRWGEASGIAQDEWLAFYEDHNGNLWARSTLRVVEMGRGADHFEDRTGSSSEQLRNDYYVSFGETSKGELITPAADGVAVWNGNGWVFYGSQQGFSREGVESLYSDTKGRVWIGVTGHGLARWLGYGAWESWTADDGLGSSVVWGLLRDDRGRLWVAHDRGISVSDEQRTRFVPVPVEAGAAAAGLGMTVGLTKDRNGRIWAVSNSGYVVRVDPNTLRAERFGKIADGLQIDSDGAGHIWIATDEGLYEQDSDAAGGTPQKVNVPGLDRGHVYRVIAKSDGTVWVAGQDGLFVKRGEAWKRIECDPCGSDNRVTDQITDMDFARDGSLWAEVNFSRVVHLELTGERVVSVEWMGPDQVSSLATQFVRFDRRGRLWVGYDRGVDLFDGQHWRLLTVADGLLWNDTNGRAFYADSDGSAWIGTSEGVSHFTGTVPGDEAPAAPKVEILAADSGSPDGGAPDGSSQEEQGRRIPWNRASIEVRFSPLSYELQGTLSYEYQLEGEDAGWVRTAEPQTRYSRLAPGNYVFRLRTIDEATRQESPVVETPFTITPRWWQSWEFRLLMVLLAVGALVVAWQMRIRQLMRRQQELEVLVAARTHELEQQATHDDLTGLLNHRGILQMLMVELERARRQKLPLAVVMADLDFFKEVNDQFGHLAGDSVLREMGARLQAGIRVYDKAGRYGGEEFLLLLPTLGGEAAKKRIEALRAALTTRPYEVEGKRLSITCSFGVVLLDGEQNHSMLWEQNEALAAADRALYLAKNNGRDRTEYATVERASTAQ